MALETPSPVQPTELDAKEKLSASESLHQQLALAVAEAATTGDFAKAEELKTQLEEQLKELSVVAGNVEYEKRTRDEEIQQLDTIEQAIEQAQTLSRDQLVFLYEIHHLHKYDGYSWSSRTKAIIEKRKKDQDLRVILGGLPHDCRSDLRLDHGLTYNRVELADITKLPDSLSGRYLISYSGEVKKELYYERRAELLRLLSIVNRTSGGQEISMEDLRFLYEIDQPIEGFSFIRNLRKTIESTIQSRDIRADLVQATSYKPEEVSLTEEESQQPDIRVHYGDLMYGKQITSAEGLSLPEIVLGDVDLGGLTSAAGLKFPKYIRGGLWLSGLTSVDGLHLPEYVGGLGLHSLTTSAAGLVLPKRVGGEIHICNLETAKGVRFPEEVDGIICLESCGREREELQKQNPHIRFDF